MSQRTNALANSLEGGARALANFASTLTVEQWQARLRKDGRKVGVIVHHVATVYPLEIQFAQSVIGSKPASITGEDVNEMNAGHARANDEVTKEDRKSVV